MAVQHGPHSDETRQHLLAGGLRLFAEQGLHNVSVRQINRAAGVGNQSAISYHFGGRDAFLHAVLEEVLRELVSDALDELKKTGVRGADGLSLRELNGVILRPFVKQMQSEQGTWRLKFLTRMISEGSEQDQKTFAEQIRPFLATYEMALTRLLPEVDPATIPHRVVLTLNTILHTLADFGMYEHLQLPELSFDALVGILLDYLEGGTRYQAPDCTVSRADSHEPIQADTR